MLLEQGEEFRVRERRAVVGQPVSFLFRVLFCRGVRSRSREVDEVGVFFFFKRGGGGV